METAQDRPDLSFVILTWNSKRYLRDCFVSLLNKMDNEGISFEIVVVDNGSHDTTRQIIEQFQKEYGSRFILIQLDSNRGTTYPRNLGIRQARGTFLCILDSDTEFGDGSVTLLLQRLGTDRTVGIIAPRLQLPDGSTQHSVKRFPTMLNKLLKVPRILFGLQTANTDFYGDFPFRDPRVVETAISACWFFRRDLIDTVGYLDEKIFYAPEDLDYSQRVWRAGYSILYYPPVTVLHHTQQITHKKPFSRTSLSHLWGLLYYFNKHGGWFSSDPIRRMLQNQRHVEQRP